MSDTIVRAQADFVGRQTAIDVLDRAFQEATAGRPAVLSVTGEPGVGKTRLVTEMGRRWGDPADQVSVAASPGAKPALRIIKQLLLALPDPDRDATIAGAIAEIDELRRRHGDRSEDPGELVAYGAVDVLLERARRRPLLLTVDDFQWADEASARTLATLAREADAIGSGVGIFILVIVREGDDGARGRMAGIERCSVYQDVRLGPLGDEEIDELIRAHGVSRPSRKVVRHVAEFSGGNPLFVREAVLRTHQSGRWRAGPNGTDADLPRGWLGAPGDLAALVASRTDALGTDVRQVLEYAALTHGSFGPELLDEAVEPGLDVQRALGRAADAGLIEPSAGGWTFAHASLRQAIAAGPDSRRRCTMHRRLADALAATRSASDDIMLAEAHHRIRSDPESIDRSAFERLAEAGRVCLDHGAWSEAAEILTVARDIADRFDPAPIDQGWLDYRLGRALHQYQQPDSARACFERAVAIASSEDAADLECLALGAIARQVHSHETDELGELLDRLDRAIDRVEPVSPQDAFGLELWRIKLLLLLGRIDEAVELARSTHAEAARWGNTDATAETASAVGMTLLAEGRPSGVLAQLESIHPRDPAELALTDARRSMALLMDARLDDAARAADQASHSFASVRQRWGQSLSEAILVNIAALRGDIAEAEHRADRGRFYLATHDYMLSGLMLYPALAELQWWAGEDDIARQTLGEWRDTGDWDPGVLGVLFDARSGHEVAGRVRTLTNELLGDQRTTMLTLSFVAPLAEAALCCGDPSLGPPLTRAVNRIADDRFHLSPGCVRLRAAALADLAVLAGEQDDAARHGRAALATAVGVGANLSITRSHLALGTNPAVSRETRVHHLDQAVELAERLGLWRLVEQASGALAGLRHTQDSRAESPPYRVVMITDLVGSTALSAEEGDHAYIEAIDSHHRLVRQELAKVQAHEFDTTGDGIIAWFAEPADAATCALSIVDQARAHRNQPGRPMQIRVGLAGGHPLERDGYLYGATLNLAARLCAEAPPNGIVTDGEFRRRCASIGEFRDLGGRQLKGFPHPVVMHELTEGCSGSMGTSTQ